jgi:hypothetical protein
MKPEHKVVISGPGTAGPNVAENGMYDFILTYYNPGANDTGAHDRALLPTWSTSGLTFDGAAALPAGVASRTIGGQTANSMSRKGSAITSGIPATYVANPGEPRTDFINNITVPMANYLTSSLHVPEFRNTNIIGAGNGWDGISSNNIFFMPTLNVGLMGDYDTINTFRLENHRGVLDIFGKSPIQMVQNITNVPNKSGYLNLWGNNASAIGVNGLYIINIRNMSNIAKVNALNPAAGSERPANVIIYPKKYNPSEISSEVSTLKPQYRAFLDGADAQSGTPKIMPVDASFTNAASYKGTVVSAGGAPDVYPLDEASWINAANNNNGAAPSAVPYSSAPKLVVGSDPW